MNAKSSLLLLTSTLFVFGCATTPMPMPTIPQGGNQAVGSFSAANNGLNLNLGYVTKSKIVFDLSLQTQFLSAKSNIYDVGLGAIGKRNKLLGMITFGYGRHDVHPFSLGLSEAVRRTHVDAFRLSGYMNFALSDDMFLIIRGSRYWGDGEHIRNGDPYNAPRFRKNFQSFAFEPALFISLGKSRHLFIGIGAHLVKEKSEFKVYDKLFDPWPIWLALGYQFGKKF